MSVLLLMLVGLVGALLMAAPAASASTGTSSHSPECNSVLHGPQGGSKTATVSSIAPNGAVTLHVTVSFPSKPDAPKPGQHIFDCVFDGTPGTGNIVGSTGTPGADCSAQGLPCSFNVTTEPLSPGSHKLCDIAKFEGFSEGTSGRRTPAFCVPVTIPTTPTPTPSPSPGGMTVPPTNTPTSSPSTGGGRGTGSPTPTPQVPPLCSRPRRCGAPRPRTDAGPTPNDPLRTPRWLPPRYRC
jgi:hypothetical protein